MLKQNLILLICIVFFQHLSAQINLSFDVEIAACEEKWVVLESEDDSTYQFGFVFAYNGGITFRLEGAFVNRVGDKFIRLPNDKVNQQVNLMGGSSFVAILPTHRLEELNLTDFPTWYEKELNTSGNIVQIFTQGFVCNSKGEYENAVKLFQKAYSINPDYNNLRYQYAKALNATKNYTKAVELLHQALKVNSVSYELLQEISLSYYYLGDIVSAELYANKGIKNCELNFPRCQMALTISMFYYQKKEKKKFEEWIKVAEKYAVEGQQQKKQINLMIGEVKKW